MIIERMDHKFSKCFKQLTLNANNSSLTVEIAVIETSGNYRDDRKERQHGQAERKDVRGDGGTRVS